jgi:hypothetical protein
VPSGKNNIRLGNAVVSHPERNLSGVIQYDLAKAHLGDVFEVTGTLQPPPRILSSAVSHLKSDPITDTFLAKCRKDIAECRKYYRPIQKRGHYSGAASEDSTITRDSLALIGHDSKTL